MATIIILLGSVLGFITAATSYIFFDVSLLASVLIWGAAGPVSTLFAALITWQPGPAVPVPARAAVPEIA